GRPGDAKPTALTTSAGWAAEGDRGMRGFGRRQSILVWGALLAECAGEKAPNAPQIGSTEEAAFDSVNGLSSVNGLDSVNAELGQRPQYVGGRRRNDVERQ